MAVNMESVKKIAAALTAAVENYEIETFKVEVTDNHIVVALEASKK